MQSGPVTAMVWSGPGVVAAARQMVGATDPARAAPGTIRGDLALLPGRNIVHASDSPDNAEREVELWFQEEEILSWSQATQDWIHN